MEARAVAEGLGEPGAWSIGNHDRSAQPCAAVGLPGTLRALGRRDSSHRTLLVKANIGRGRRRVERTRDAGDALLGKIKKTSSLRHSGRPSRKSAFAAFPFAFEFDEARSGRGV